MMTWVCPGPKIKAVTLCHTRGSASPGRVNWGSDELSGIFMNYVTTSLLEVSVHMIDLVISCLVTLMTVNTIVYLEINVDLHDLYTAVSVS